MTDTKTGTMTRMGVKLLIYSAMEEHNRECKCYELNCPLLVEKLADKFENDKLATE